MNGKRVRWPPHPFPVYVRLANPSPARNNPHCPNIFKIMRWWVEAMGTVRANVARACLVLALSAVGVVAIETPAHATVSIVSDNQYGVDFVNNDGQWTIWKNCFEYFDGTKTVAIGPGYLGRLQRGNYWIVNDERDKNPPNEGAPSINHPSFGGLGQFGWHHARGDIGALNTSDVNHVWNITGRTCAATNGGFGVVAAQVLQGPYISANVGYFDIDVFFGDVVRGAGNPLLRVRYRWRIFDSVIKMWAQVSEYCANGCYDPNWHYAFIKEPKFVANVKSTVGHAFPGYTRTAVFDRFGNLCNIFLGTDPTAATGHSACDQRARFRFDFGTGSSGTDGGCNSTDHPCLNVVATAYDIDDGAFSQSRQHYLWEGQGWGLDQWAVLSGEPGAARPAGNSTGCNTSAGFATSPEQDAVRRWELIGGPKPDGTHYDSAEAMFPAWEGCNSAYSAGSLYRLWASEYWGVHMQFSINDGWSIPSMP